MISCIWYMPVCSGLTSHQQFFSHITMVTECDRELPHWSIMPQTLEWYDTQSHYPDTGSTSPSCTTKVWVPSEEQLIPFLTTLVCRSLGSNTGDHPFPGVDQLSYRERCGICLWPGHQVNGWRTLGQNYIICQLTSQILFIDLLHTHISQSLWGK